MRYHPDFDRSRDHADPTTLRAHGETNEARMRRMINDYKVEQAAAVFDVLADEAITLARDLDRNVEAMNVLAEPYRSQ